MLAKSRERAQATPAAARKAGREAKETAE
jgi:hypothetical protein